MYTIVVTPNPILIKKTQKVTQFDKKLDDILEQMEETLRATTDPVGVGLAAPQVGLSLAIFQMKPTDDSPVKNFINPVIIPKPHTKGLINTTEKKKPRKGKLLEGCLSIPNIWGHVTREKNVTLEWQDEKGKKHKKYFTGFPAVIIQHEMDHLQGLLFTKHVIEQGGKLYKSHKNAEGEDEFDEVKL
ncbi:MAG TPA: peptide deformylase [Candidatus Levybacteria bacterium]|nr:peptide deformylase [Candidatus Levybacteria bacterium]